MTDQNQTPYPSVGETDGTAELIIPPEQPPMDDAAGGPRGDAVKQSADDIEPGEEEVAAQMGSLS